MGKVRVNNVVIDCEHRQATTRKPKNCKDMEIFVRYEEWERMVKCDEQQDETKSPYVKTTEELLGNYNPVDCESCKSFLSNYLTSIMFHPNPNKVLQDIYDKVSSLVRRLGTSKKVCGTYAVYEIVNNIERHCKSRNKERLITWVDYQPQPRRAMEVVKEAGLPTEGEGEGFTCAICLDGVKNKGKKRKRSNDDDQEVARQEEEPDCCANNRVVRSVSCHHMFHKTCIDRWVKDCGHDTCPLCRFQLPNVSRCRCNWELSKKRALDNSKVVKTDLLKQVDCYII